MATVESVQKFLVKDPPKCAVTIDALPGKLFDSFVAHDIQVDLVEHGRILSSMKVSPRLLNEENALHGAAIASILGMVGTAVIYAAVGATRLGVSVEFNVSYLGAAFAHEELEIEAKTLRTGRSLAVASIKLRKKETGKLIAVGRYAKTLAAPSKL